MAISRIGRGSVGELDSVFTNSQTGLPNLAKVEPCVPGSDQVAIGIDRGESLEILLDAGAHVIVKVPLLGVELRTG